MITGNIWTLVILGFLQETRGSPCRVVNDYFPYFYKSSQLESHCLACVTFKDESESLLQISCSTNDLAVTLENREYTGLHSDGRRMMIALKSDYSYYFDSNEFGVSHWASDMVVSLDLSDAMEVRRDQEYILHRFPYLIDLNLKSTSFIMDTNTNLNLTRLQVLNLSYNKIKAVEKSNFKHLVNLFKLDLSYNEIDFLPVDVFAMQSHLEELLLNNNKLMHFDLPIKNISHSLVPSLNLSFNNITNIELNGFFRKLNVSHNKLSRFPFNLSSVTTSLDLSYNELTNIDAYTLTNVSNLEVINLKHNLLSSLNTINLFSERLIELDISDNLFTLSSNGRNNNWMLLFMLCPHLKQVSLSGNLWTCPDLRDIIHILKARKVSIVEGNTYGKTNFMGIECSASPSNATVEDSSPTFDQFFIEKILNTIHSQTALKNNASQAKSQQNDKLISRIEQLEQNLEKIRLGATIQGDQAIGDQLYKIIDVKVAKIKDEVIESNKDKISMAKMEQQLMALTHNQAIFSNNKDPNYGQIVIIMILLFLLFSAMISQIYLYSKIKKLRKGVESENVGLVNI